MAETKLSCFWHGPTWAGKLRPGYRFTVVSDVPAEILIEVIPTKVVSTEAVSSEALS
jgi:hypothetical protein